MGSYIVRKYKLNLNIFIFDITNSSFILALLLFSLNVNKFFISNIKNDKASTRNKINLPCRTQHGRYGEEPRTRLFTSV